MANPLNGKKLSVMDSRSIGEIMQSPINLETLTTGQWLALDGRFLSRASYPELAPYFPIGTFTATVRTLAGAPVVSTITADSTNFLAASAAGTSPIQATADGATWSDSATWGASTSVTSLIVAGTRYVMAGSAGDLTAPYVSNTGQTAANQVAKANWTATTGGTTTSLLTGLAYSSTLGRTILAKNGLLATDSGLFYLADGATAWNACSGGSTIARIGVVWTGQKYLTVNADGVMQTSTDGGAFVDGIVDSFGFTSINLLTLTSDGAGTVVCYGYGTFNDGVAGAAYGFFVSKDHGATWRFISGTDIVVGSNAFYISFINGKFVFNSLGSATSTSSTAISVDGLDWKRVAFHNGGIANIASSNFGSVAYKSSVYCTIQSADTPARTIIEDTSKFRLPVAAIINAAPYVKGILPNSYIKARS